MSVQAPYAGCEPGKRLSTTSPRPNGARDPWSKAADALLKRLWPLVQCRDLSAREAAAKINAELGTTYTRSALLGRAFRLGMCHPEATPRERRPVVAWGVNTVSRWNQCPYPLWPDGEAPTFRYCCKPLAEGSNWCREHKAICVSRTVPGMKAAPKKEQPKISRFELARKAVFGGGL